MSYSFRRLAPFVAVLALALHGAAQTALTAADYARAEKFMGYNTEPLVYHAVHPVWAGDERLWYRDTDAGGSSFVLFDAVKLAKEPAFDHVKLAAALSAAAGKKYEPNKLPFRTIEFSADGLSVEFSAGGKKYRCDRQGSQCTAEKGGAGGFFRTDSPSPDKKKTAFIRQYNLWVRDLATGKETQLTTDGVKDNSYALDNAGWIKSERAILAWSPDSKKIATFQQDQRNVGEMYLVETMPGHPTLHAWKYPLPGDDTVAMIRRVIIDVDTPKVIPLQMPPDQHRSTLCDHVACGMSSEWVDVEWSKDASKLAFVSTSRDHKQETLRIASAADGAVRDVMEEHVSTQYESGQGTVNWRYLPDSNEIIWYSERSNWGHLYLYDSDTGKLKNQVTSGDFVVTQLLHVDENARLLYFVADGREKGDPYFDHLYRVSFDGSGLTLLTPEDGNHEVTFSPSGKLFLDSYSKSDAPPVTVLRAADGKLLATLETADISQLEATGWKPPLAVTVKARDGATDLYGLLFKPTNFDPSKKYPIINQIYPGPQSGSLGVYGRSFAASHGDAQALAELGFVVVMIDGMGNPQRSKSFHDAYYGDMGDNTLPDQVAGMQELARRYPWIDIDHAGIWGHSGGGYAAADAMFRYPDFFKVGVSEAGNHDNREYEDDWGERYQGLLVKSKDGSNYDGQANQSLAKNLKGHLLLAHGTMDSNVPPYNTLLVVNELIKANKDFDLLLLPNRSHGFGNEPYMVRRRWDYFVRYLMGAEPPKEYQLKPANGGRGGGGE